MRQNVSKYDQMSKYDQLYKYDKMRTMKNNLISALLFLVGGSAIIGCTNARLIQPEEASEEVQRRARN